MADKETFPVNNDDDVVGYGQAAAQDPTAGAYDQVLQANPQVIFASARGPLSPKLLVNFVLDIMDQIDGGLSPYIRQLGEDFIWGVYAHRVLGTEVEEADKVLFPRYEVHADWSVAAICNRIGVPTKRQFGDGYLDLAKLDMVTKLVSIAELKPEGQKPAGVAQIMKYEAAFASRGVTTERATNEAFLLPTTFVRTPFSYQFVGDGVFEWSEDWSKEKELYEKVKQFAFDYADLAKIVAFVALLVLIAALLKNAGAILTEPAPPPVFA